MLKKNNPSGSIFPGSVIDLTLRDSDFIDGYPCLVRTTADELLLAFSRRPKSDEMTTGWIELVRSVDSGRTWSEPVTLIDTPDMIDVDPSIVTWDHSVLVISTAVPKTHVRQVTISKLMAVRSDDGGRTWSDPFEIDKPYTYVSGKISPGVQFADGTLAFGFSWDVKLQKGQTVLADKDSWNEAGVMISTDGAQTWHPGQTLNLRKARPDGIDAINGLDEPTVAVGKNGDLFMLMRTGFDRLYAARSRDHGRTWSDPYPTSLVSHNAPATLCAFTHPHRGSGWLVIYNHSPLHRFPLAAAVSFDDGATWSDPTVITDPGQPAHYPAAAQTPEGYIQAVWQQDTPAGRNLQGAWINVE